jgi:hypothetical protein
MRRLIFLFVIQFIAVNAWSCAVCLCGDPSLTLFGMEKSYPGQWRLSLDSIFRQEQVGEAGLNQQQLDDVRLNFNVSYQLHRRLGLALTFPYVNKKLRFDNLSTQEVSDFGDIELSSRYTLYDASRHQLHLQFNLRLPTATEQRDQQNKALNIDVQAGTGAYLPKLGLSYGYFRYPWLFYSSLQWQIGENKGFQGFVPGSAWLTTFSGQYALTPRLALALALDSRFSEKNQFFNQKDQDSGGSIHFLSTKLLWRVNQHWLLEATMQQPIVEQLNGTLTEKTNYRFGLIYDF